jgi:hypothetical protein
VLFVDVVEVRGDAQNRAECSGGLIEGGLGMSGELGMTVSFNWIGRDQGELKLRSLRLVVSSFVRALASNSSDAAFTLIKTRFFNSWGWQSLRVKV